MKPTVVVGVACLAGALACSQPATREARPAPPTAPQPRPGAVTLTIIGTNDLHGALERLPIFAGYINNLRAARAADGGGVVLLDGGDMFQGTLESNLSEGADVVRAYNQIGYTAAAVGNHEFDYGPEGPAATASSVEEDARGALKARAAEAKFPLLVANILDAKSGARIKWPNMPPSTLVEVAGIKLGIIGASTEATPYTTMPANFLGLVMQPPAIAVAEEAKALRARGAQVIAVTAHIGSRCKQLDVPTDLSSCEHDEELFKMIAELPKGAVDVIVGGHTHAAIAHRVSDIAVIESYSSGRAFGRVDLRISPNGHVTATKIHPPKLMCGDGLEGNPVAASACKPSDYEGKPVVPDPAVAAIVTEAVARAGARRAEKLGAVLSKPVTRSYGSESAEGNWFCDLMLAVRPDAQVSLTNGGGLRADLPAGDLTYGQLFEAMPFDNRFAVVDLKGVHLRQMVATNLQRSGGILSFGGLTAVARCKGNTLDVQIKVAGKPLDDARGYRLVTSDFLASGGDGVIGRLNLPASAIKLTDAIIRDELAAYLQKQKALKVDADALTAKRRLDFEGKRPVRCGPPPTAPAATGSGAPPAKEPAE